MKVKIALWVVVIMAVISSLFGVTGSAQAATVPVSVPAAAAPVGYTPPVVCVNASEPTTGRIRLSQATNPVGLFRKSFYVDVQQGRKICVNKLGPSFIKPTWYRYRYQVPKGVKCDGRIGGGLVNVRIKTTFYDYKGNPVKSMPRLKIPCDSDGTASIYGRYGYRTAPSLVYLNSSAAGSPKMRVSVGINWVGEDPSVGVPDATGVIYQHLLARR